MSAISEKQITAALEKLALFAREYPSGPCGKALLALRHLRDACARLREQKGLPAEKSAKGKLPTRKRRKGPKHPHGTPAHIKVLANIEVEKKSGCWIWLGSGTPRYGTVNSQKTRNDYVHRVMYEHANGRDLDPGEVVRHTCDNGFCCNPEHLLIGTQRENALDRTSRRRGGVQKLSERDAKDILIRKREGEAAGVLAIEYGMSVVGISHIGRNTFTYLNDDPDVKAVGVSLAASRKLSAENAREIKQHLLAGDDHEKIAQQFKVTVAYIRDIANGRRWRSVD